MLFILKYLFNNYWSINGWTEKMDELIMTDDYIKIHVNLTDLIDHKATK